MDIPSSGDLLADRRFSWGEAFAGEGDHAAAADLFEQALQRTPHWAPAWLALGLARERLGDRDGALAAVDRAAAADPDGVLGAPLHRARMSGVPVHAMPQDFVTALFDGYADRFDDHLAALQYNAPLVIVEALVRAGAGLFAEALDLGCGTGLMASQLRGRAGAIDGVDLSSRMVAQACRTKLYRHLAVQEIEGFMSATPGGCFDLVVAADVFVYLGGLDHVCREAARLLRPDGWIAFTVQKLNDADRFALGDDMRFSHGRAYVEAVLAGAGFTVAALDDASTRTDRGRPVPGLVAVARKA